jgi:hypothetical protein
MRVGTYNVITVYDLSILLTLVKQITLLYKTYII